MRTGFWPHSWIRWIKFTVTKQLNNYFNRSRGFRARNNGRSTDNVRTDCGFDRSNFRLAGHVDRSKLNRIVNEINLRFLLFNCFSCYLSSHCVLGTFIWNPGDMQLEPLFTIRASKQTIRPLPVTKLQNISTFISNFHVVDLSLRIN